MTLYLIKKKKKKKNNFILYIKEVNNLFDFLKYNQILIKYLL